MQVTEYAIACTTKRTATGARVPSSGVVTFDDGRTYHYFARIERDPITGQLRHMGRYFFTTYRNTPDGNRRYFNFTSRPREQALVEALNS